MQVILAQPRGFCAGVIRAIKIVHQALENHGTPVYVLHEIVHNRQVVEDLKHRGALFVESLEEVPSGAVTIFSAHGVSTAVVKEAGKRDLRVIDATCPLVTKVHLLAQQFSRDLYQEGVFAVGFFYPVVAVGQARIRTQMSAALNQQHLDRALVAFTKIGKKHGILGLKKEEIIAKYAGGK